MSLYNTTINQPALYASVVLTPTQYEGPFTDVFVKPIYSTDSTVQITIPVNFTVFQFYELLRQIISEREVFSELEQPQFPHNFEILCAGQPNALYTNRIILPYQLRRDGRTASEFAPALNRDSFESIMSFSNETFYLRYVHIDEPLEDGEISEIANDTEMTINDFV